MPDEPTPSTSRPAGSREALAWLDRIKGLALLWIFLNHLVERIFGYPHIANPNGHWVPIAERIEQLRPLSIPGPWDLPVNLVRYLGWFGDQGVQLFLVASGFGLVWGLLGREAPAELPAIEFYRRRAARILPLWWGAHILFTASWAITGYGPTPVSPAFWASLIGIRVTPDQLYFFCPSWWYVGLLVQLYLVFPWLWRWLRLRGPVWLLTRVGGAALLVRGAGLLFFDGYLDAWSRGAIFVTRLPEFLLGMCLACWLHRRRSETHARLVSPGMLLGAAAAWSVGTWLSLSLVGMTVAPFLLAAGAFLLLYAIVPRRQGGPLVRIGRNSYSLYLLHQIPILLLVPEGVLTLRAVLPATLLAVLLTALGAWLLQALVRRAQTLLSWGRQRWGALPTATAVAIAGGVAAASIVGAEMVVQRADPQEVLGWGERPALEPHEEFGWRLRPGRTTRLRWESYDYEVTANELGFPGPAPRAAGQEGSPRVLVAGDAFSSAEGVDTDESWPRRLQSLLGADAEVVDLAITGHGPRQEAAVLARYVPELRPDLVVLEMYVNDFDDVMVNDEAFHNSIGFDRPAQTGMRAALRRAHLRRWLKLHAWEPILELIQGTPRPHGWFVTGLGSLVRSDPATQREEDRLVRERLQEMRDAADAAGARMAVVMVPAPAQICGPASLAYYPRGVDPNDASRFDPERPQRSARRIAAQLALPFLDLREALRAVAPCPYQRRNLHWTAAGHQAAAEAVARFLGANGLLDDHGS